VQKFKLKTVKRLRVLLLKILRLYRFIVLSNQLFTLICILKLEINIFSNKSCFHFKISKVILILNALTVFFLDLILK